MTIKGEYFYNHLITKALKSMPKINKYRKDFLLEIFVLFLSIKGRINFLQMGRFGKFGEQRYRRQFEKPFDFLTFNKKLFISHIGERRANALDPSYVSKSGKHTPGIGYFWSGVAGQSKKGLEIAGIATIDMDNHTGFHLEAVQTIVDANDNKTLAEHYANVISERAEQLLSISPYLVVDAWFAKQTFIQKVRESNIHVICRFRDDAHLKYLFTGQQKKGRGRPRKYIGLVDPNNIDTDYFDFVLDDDEKTVHTAIVYSKSLDANVKVVHVVYKSSKKKKIYKLYFSTDTKMDAIDILDYYRTRFQIEFLYRDGKQFTGLNNSQARSENKLNFHFNASLTAINIAKIQHWINIPKEQRKSFSMSDIKTVNHNIVMLDLFFRRFGINSKLTKNQKIFKELIYYGTIAA